MHKNLQQLKMYLFIVTFQIFFVAANAINKTQNLCINCDCQYGDPKFALVDCDNLLMKKVGIFVSS